MLIPKKRSVGGFREAIDLEIGKTETLPSMLPETV